MASMCKKAKMEYLSEIIQFIKAGAEGIDFTKKQLYNLTLASEEILVNIISYAYPESTGSIKIIYKKLAGKKGLKIKFIDKGIAFNPLTKQTADITLPIEKRKVGGLGIMLVLKTINEVDYQRKGKKNILTIKLIVD